MSVAAISPCVVCATIALRPQGWAPGVETMALLMLLFSKTGSLTAIEQVRRELCFRHRRAIEEQSRAYDASKEGA